MRCCRQAAAPEKCSYFQYANGEVRPPPPPPTPRGALGDLPGDDGCSRLRAPHVEAVTAGVQITLAVQKGGCSTRGPVVKNPHPQNRGEDVEFVSLSLRDMEGPLPSDSWQPQPVTPAASPPQVLEWLGEAGVRLVVVGDSMMHQLWTRLVALLRDQRPVFDYRVFTHARYSVPPPPSPGPGAVMRMRCAAFYF